MNSEPVVEPLLVAYVEWQDSGIVATGWEDRSDVVERAVEMQTKLLQSAGLLVSQDEHQITLALSLNRYRDDLAQVMTIPRPVIRRVHIWSVPSAEVLDRG